MLIGINQSLLYYRFSNVYTSLTLFLHFLKTSRSFKPRWMFLNQREKSIFQPPTITCVRFSTSNRKTRYPAPLNYRNRANYPPNPNHPGFDPTWHMVLVHVTNQCMRHSPCLPALAGHGCSALQTPAAELCSPPRAAELRP